MIFLSCKDKYLKVRPLAQSSGAGDLKTTQLGCLVHPRFGFGRLEVVRVEKRRLDCTADGKGPVGKLDGRQLVDDSLGLIVDLVAVLANDL